MGIILHHKHALRVGAALLVPALVASCPVAMGTAGPRTEIARAVGRAQPASGGEVALQSRIDAEPAPSPVNAALRFSDADLAALERRFAVATGRSGLTVYPGAAPRNCWVGSRRPPLARLLRAELSGPAAVMPLGCLFGAYPAAELLALARAGDPRARFLYVGLLLETNGCSDDTNAAALQRISDQGYAPASIAMGNFLVGCGQRGPGVARYRLAEAQGFINARGYYRGLELAPPQPSH